MEAIQEFSKVVLSQDNCIIPNERLRNTPSSKDGCPHDLEVELRIVGCEHIQTAGTLLRLPQVAMSTAQVLFQRFFYIKSLIKYNMMHVAMACIFLAAKIEENCRRVRDVANVFHHLKQKRMGRPVVPMEYMGEEYFKLKASIIKYERFILRDLGFCVHVRNPHKLIIAYLQILELEKNKQLAQRSWNFMNDSLRTNVFVRYLPETIACSCIFLAARQLKIPLPQKPPWWTVFEVIYEDIEAVCLEVLALYRKPRLFLFDLEKRLNVLKEEYAKKQVEIKEVSLKKPVTDSPSDSPSKQADSELQPQDKEKEPSPPPTSSSVTGDKQRPSPLTTSQTSAPISSTVKQLSTSAIVTTSQSVSPPPPVSSLSLPLHVENNHTSKSSPPPSKSKLDRPSLSKKRKTSPNLSRNRVSPPPAKRKVVISPIRVAASSGESVSEGSLSPRENGLPEQYRRNRNKASSSTNSRHHHRHSRRSSLDRHRDRRHRDGSRKRRVHDDRPKSRRTEHDRYR